MPDVLLTPFGFSSMRYLFKTWRTVEDFSGREQILLKITMTKTKKQMNKQIVNSVELSSS
jgi:hypothetical protein